MPVYPPPTIATSASTSPTSAGAQALVALGGQRLAQPPAALECPGIGRERSWVGHGARWYDPAQGAAIGGDESADPARTPVSSTACARRSAATAARCSDVRPDDLAAHVIRALVERTGIDPAAIDDVILGAANQAGEDNRNVGRMAALLAGLPIEVAGQTVNRLCGSGLQAVVERRARDRLRRRHRSSWRAASSR